MVIIIIILFIYLFIYCLVNGKEPLNVFALPSWNAVEVTLNYRCL